MHRSARNLLSVSVLVPMAAALAVAVAPANATQGPSAEILYGTTAPVARSLPSDVVPVSAATPAAQVTGTATGTVDGVLKSKPKRTPRPRTARTATGAHACPLDQVIGSFPVNAGNLGGARRGCLERRAAGPSPKNPVDAAGNVVDSTGKVIGNATKATKQVQAGPLNKIAAVTRSASNSPILPDARRTTDRPRGLNLMGVVPGAVRSAEALGLPVSYSALFPPAAHRGLTRPSPDDGVVDQAGDVVHEAGSGVDTTRGQVVEVLKAADHASTPSKALPTKPHQTPPGKRVARPRPSTGLLGGGLPQLPIQATSLPVTGLG
ncbi:hypothetical protein [Actinomadura macra]|uniref:hypothetical protein n=1 Tax=Actinomadura macra TaxID=46164 RepID=UPI000832B2F2|nr:hypothetical protein [Actinomadura macra]